MLPPHSVNEMLCQLKENTPQIYIDAYTNEIYYHNGVRVVINFIAISSIIRIIIIINISNSIFINYTMFMYASLSSPSSLYCNYHHPCSVLVVDLGVFSYLCTCEYLLTICNTKKTGDWETLWRFFFISFFSIPSHCVLVCLRAGEWPTTIYSDGSNTPEGVFSPRLHLAAQKCDISKHRIQCCIVII